MAKTTTVGRIALKRILPADLQEYAEKPLDKKAAGELFEKLSRNYPEDYVDIVHELTNHANKVSTEYGRETSLSLKDLKLPKKVSEYRKAMQKRVHEITQRDMDPEEKNKALVSYLQGHVNKVRDMIEEEGVKEGNALAMSSRHGFRGNKVQLMQMLFGDLIVTDNQGKPIAVPLLHGFVEGLDPLETWAQSYASRAGYCLHEDTPVRMADGSVKQLKDVKVGDWVAGSDLEGNTKPVRVTAVIDQGMRHTWLYTFRTSSPDRSPVEFECTKDHKALQRAEQPESSVRVAPVSEACKGAGILTARDEQNEGVGQFCVYVGREPMGLRHVMDLSVDSPEHLFVLANGAVVSNSKVQFATRDAGYLGKQLEFIGSGLTVTDEDCGTKHGIPLKATDEGAAGRVLVEDVAGFKAGTVLTPAVRKKMGDREITLRNPRTCEDEHGICSKCAGVRPNGKFAAVGDYLGGKVARFMSEPMTQNMALSAKHLGTGIRGKEDPQDIPGGFPEVNQLLQMPESSFAGAVHAEADGLVKDVKKAPQGGSYVTVDDEKYYIHDALTPQVKKGDKVLAGDPLSNGMQHPGKVAKYKGIGKAREVFGHEWEKLVTKHGIKALPQNVDILSRAFIRNVRVTDPDGIGGFRFGEVVPYDVLQKRWTVPESARERSLDKAEGAYLQKPTLHYTIGTRLTKPVLADLKKRNISSVPVSDDEPGFEPYITRAATRSLLDRDWKARLSGFHLKKAFTDAAAMGATDSPEGRKSVHAGLWNPGTRGQ